MLLCLLLLLPTATAEAFGAREGTSVHLSDAARQPQRFALSEDRQQQQQQQQQPGHHHRVLTSLDALRPVSSEFCFPVIFTNRMYRMAPLFVASMRANRDASWVLVHFSSDGGDSATHAALSPLLPPWLEWPPNLQVVSVSAAELQAFVERKLGLRFAQPLSGIDGPKLNDWKAAFGALFEEWIGGCKFWGFADTDLVYGRLDAAVPASLRERFDVISPRATRLAGPFTLFRTAVTRELFREDPEWKLVLGDWAKRGAFGFRGLRMYDELGMSALVKKAAAAGRLRASFGGEGELGIECSTGISVGERCTWDAASGAIEVTGRAGGAGGGSAAGPALRALYIHVGDAKRHTEGSMTEQYVKQLLRAGLFFTSLDATFALLEGARVKREPLHGEKGAPLAAFEYIGLRDHGCRHLLPRPARLDASGKCAKSMRAHRHELMTLQGQFCVCAAGWCARGRGAAAACVHRAPTGDPLQDRWVVEDEPAPWPHGALPATMQGAGMDISVYRPFM